MNYDFYNTVQTSTRKFVELETGELFTLTRFNDMYDLSGQYFFDLYSKEGPSTMKVLSYPFPKPTYKAGEMINKIHHTHEVFPIKLLLIKHKLYVYTYKLENNTYGSCFNKTDIPSNAVESSCKIFEFSGPIQDGSRSFEQLTELQKFIDLIKENNEKNTLTILEKS